MIVSAENMEAVEATVATLLGVAPDMKDSSSSSSSSSPFSNCGLSHHHKLKSLAAAAERADLLGSDAEEKAAIHQWIELTLRHASSSSSSSLSSSSSSLPVDARALAEELDARLARRAFVAAPRLTLADLVLFAASHAHFAGATFAEKERLLNASRWFAHVQACFRCDVGGAKARTCLNADEMPVVAFVRNRLYHLNV